MFNTLLKAVDIIGTQPANVKGFIPTSDVNARIMGAINLVLTLTVILSVFYIIMGGINYINAQGDPAKAKGAQQVVTNAVIGLVVAFSSYVVLVVVGSAIGIGPADWVLEL